MTPEPFDARAAVLARIDPATTARRDETMHALHDAGATLQDAQHQLKAAELSGTEDDEARCLVRVRRAERTYAEAEQQAQQAQQAYGAAFVAAWRAVRDIEYRAHEAFLCEAEARVAAAQQAVVDTDLALV